MAPRKGNTQQSAPALPERLLRWLFAGIAFVLVCAAALSAPTLYSLARLIDFPKQLAWLLPAALDGYAATSIWFGRRIEPTHPAYKSARRNSRLSLGMTVACNGLYHFLVLAGALVPGWVRIVLLVAVSALPPAIVDRLLHLNSLAGGGTVESAAPVSAPEKKQGPASKTGAGIKPQAALAPPVDADSFKEAASGIPASGNEPGIEDEENAGIGPAAKVGTNGIGKPSDAEEKRQMPGGTVTQINRNGKRSLSPDEWAVYALPLYRRHVATHNDVPTAATLANLIREAHPDLPMPRAERSERNIRAATERLAEASESEPERETEVA